MGVTVSDAFELYYEVAVSVECHGTVLAPEMVCTHWGGAFDSDSLVTPGTIIPESGRAYRAMVTSDTVVSCVDIFGAVLAAYSNNVGRVSLLWLAICVTTDYSECEVVTGGHEVYVEVGEWTDVAHVSAGEPTNVFV